MPGVANLDAWGRDPEAATAMLVAAVADPAMPFRTPLGEDSALFAMMKGSLPYEARAWALRAIVGLPAPGAFVDRAAEEPLETTMASVVQRLASAAAADPGLATLLTGLAAKAPTVG